MDNATETIKSEIKQIFPDSNSIIDEEKSKPSNKPLFYVKKKSYTTDLTCTISKSACFYEGIMIPKSEFQINLNNKI